LKALPETAEAAASALQNARTASVTLGTVLANPSYDYATPLQPFLEGLLETEWVKTRVFSQVDRGFKGHLVNIAVTSSWHVERMPKSAKTKRLRDSYRFPGFHPALTVGGLFGDPTLA
jgi:hypothetical protein